MKFIDWNYIDEHRDNFDVMYQSFSSCGIEMLVSEVQQDWSEELILQFYATVWFEEDTISTFKWMSNGIVYTFDYEEFGNLLGLSRSNIDKVDIYEKPNMEAKI